MSTVDIVDETFLAVPVKVVAAAFSDPASWRRYWPDLVLDCYADRGDEGMRWTVSGGLEGTMEIWLEPVLDGTLVHYFLRARLPADRVAGSTAARRRRCGGEAVRRQLAAKRLALELKFALEDGRAPGEPPALDTTAE